MRYETASQRLAGYRKELAGLRKKMQKLQRSAEAEPVEDYEFATVKGPVRLSRLFGKKEHLFVIHNMGASCRYCTLWADGFNGLYPHLADRAAFVVASPDAPKKQLRFKTARGWRFPMVSHSETSFAADMGYKSKEWWMPGVSVFTKRGKKIYRVSDTGFGPGDDFCALWHFFDLLPKGAGDWQPQYKYR
ncbi:MAG: DUF899 family protein [Proteobacteria bacterium]|nr:DUF899 family protein [Pseudomonadota bacterium]MBI3497145.1 DUF899 family protein [Pseudomonadota bacterium]